MCRLPFSCLAIAAALTVGACSSRVQRFDYDYGTDHPSYRSGYSRLGGPSPVAAHAVPRRPTHAVTVASGDSLSAIAHRYGIGVDELRQANELTSDRLRVGQILVVPGSPL